jgi:hypothetical protein
MGILLLFLLYFDKVKIPRWGVSSSTPMAAQSVHIYKEEPRRRRRWIKSLFFLLLVILDFVPWSLTGAAIFDDEWTERRKWENQPATTALCCVNNRNTHKHVQAERAIMAYQHAKFTKQTNMTWHRL